jgi:hypothetical protein
LEPEGSGTLESPYLISDANELGVVYHYQSNVHYKLTSDIDLFGINWSIPPIPVFNGTFDGAGYTISNLTIDGVVYLGLFGHILSNGQVMNLSMGNVNIFGNGYLGGLCGRNGGNISNCFATCSITGGDFSSSLGGLCGANNGAIKDCNSTGSVASGNYSECIGGLCGYNEGGDISNCFASVSVSGGDNSGLLGGLCGWNDGMIINCCATGSVNGNYSDSLGGLCGYNSGGTINNCYADGLVNGGVNSDNLGGLCGYNSGGTINNCYAGGLVDGRRYSDYLGGLCGSNSGSISTCYATGAVTGNDYLGGLCGGNFNSTISTCYATGTVTGYDYLGGLCGYNYFGTISNCYATGQVTGRDRGGLVGSDSTGIYTKSFWNTTVNAGLIGIGNGSDPNVIGESTTDMQEIITYNDAGWDFVGESANGTNDIWRMCTDGVHYPHLFHQYNCCGDFACPDGSGFDDLIALSQNWLNSEALDPGFNYPCDPTFDGVTNLGDFTILSEHWLE